MPEQLIATAGAWYISACAALFVMALVEQAGAPRSPEQDEHRKNALAKALLLTSLLTPALLLLQGYFVTAGAESTQRAAIMGAPIAAMLLGSLLGAFLGALLGHAASAMRKLAWPLALIALALALYAVHPSIVALVKALQSGVLDLPVRGV